MFVWFFQPFLAQESLTVFSATVFATHGIAFAVQTLVAFAIGALAGMGIRRIVPAMAVTLGVYTGLALATWLFLREQYPLSLVGKPNLSLAPPSVNDPWILSTFYTGPGGKPASKSVVNQIIALFPTDGPPRVKETLAQEFAQHDITVWQRYIPVSRFWPMQFVEAGWLLALSVLLIAATVWLVRRRAA